MSSPPAAIDLFCGAGGLSKGLEMAGFQVAIAVDSDDSVAQTYSYNHPNTAFVQADLSVTPVDRITAATGRKSFRPSILVGGPPCEGFSNANTTTRTRKNPKNQLIFKFVDAVSKLQPTLFLVENVPNVVTVEDGELMKRLVAKCEAMGYSTTSFILDAVDYGVPQVRKRFMLVGSLDGEMKGPAPIRENGHRVTVRDAIIGDLPRLSMRQAVRIYRYVSKPRSRYQRFIRGKARNVYNHTLVRSSEEVRARSSHIRPGGTIANVPARYRRDLNVQHSYMYRRLNPNEPAHTIVTTAKAMTWHPFQNRAITNREAARLQSFQDDYIFIGPVKSASQMVANAVPPLLAYAMFKQLHTMLVN
jgi:DNA (cytosine-5)-methyltransferase 1